MKCKMTKGIKISKKLLDRLNEISKENLNKENSNFKQFVKFYKQTIL